MSYSVINREYNINLVLSKVAAEALIDESCYSVYVEGVPTSGWWHVNNKASCIFNGVIFGELPSSITTFHRSYGSRLYNHFLFLTD